MTKEVIMTALITAVLTVGLIVAKDKFMTK